SPFELSDHSPPIRTQYHRVIYLHRRTSMVTYAVTLEHRSRPPSSGAQFHPTPPASLLQICLNCNSLQMNTCATPRRKPFIFNTCEKVVGGVPPPIISLCFMQLRTERVDNPRRQTSVA